MKYPIFLLLLLVSFIIYNLTLFSASSNTGIVLWDMTQTSMLYRYSYIVGIPFSHVLLQKNRVLRLKERPVSGDHIHMSMTIYVNGKLRSPEHDRPIREDIPYEQKPKVCNISGTIAYTKLWPHAGVHTHCDGLIHVHPWSAPRVIRKEGLDVQLGLWFDQVGIRYREVPKPSLSFGDERFDGNETHAWRLSERICYKDTTSNVYWQGLDQIWLGYAYSSYVLWYGPIDSEIPNPDPDHIDQLLHVDALLSVGANGFDGYDYPSICNPLN